MDIISAWLTWRIKIQLLHLQLTQAQHEGAHTWLSPILITLKEINQLAVSFGPFDYQILPVQPWPPYLVRPANGEFLFEALSQQLIQFVGTV